LSAEGNEIESVILAAKDLEDIAKSDFRLNLEKDLFYLELGADLIAKTDMNPITEVQKFVGDRYNEFNSIMDVDTSAYVISLAPKGANVNDGKWFDIRIEPRVTAPDREYYINLVYRDTNPKDVFSFARNLEDKVSAILNKIRGA